MLFLFSPSATNVRRGIGGCDPMEKIFHRHCRLHSSLLHPYGSFMPDWE